MKGLDFMVILKAKGIKKLFNGVCALDNVSFELKKAEVLGVIGPNGAGKTTLIHILLGLITPDDGYVEVLGKEFSKHREEILQHMNFASSYVGLPLSLTPWENLYIYALIYNVDEPQKKCRQMLELFELIDVSNQPSRRLSSGQMMRLALAKCMINDPRILLLDEPTASLDPEIALRIRKLLKRICVERGISIVYTSHNLRDIEEISDRILFLEKGRVVAIEEKSDLIKRYGTLEGFFFRNLCNEL